MISATPCRDHHPKQVMCATAAEAEPWSHLERQPDEHKALDRPTRLGVPDSHGDPSVRPGPRWLPRYDRTWLRFDAVASQGQLMGQAIGQVLSYGVGVALSPVPIIAVVLMLATPKGRVNGPAFLLGWIVGLAVVGTVVLLVASGASASQDGTPATWVSILKIVLGVLLLALALKQWRGRPRGDAEPQLPGWMRSIDKFTPVRSTAIGVVLSAINPKNLLLAVGASAAIAQTGASGGSQAVALGVFIVIASIGVAAPVVVSALMGERAGRILGTLHDWMARENATIMTVICLIIGAKLIGDAITALAS